MQTLENLRVHIRWMIRRDMGEVLAIERQSFESAWTEEDFLNYLRQRNCIGMVAEHNDRIIGFMIYELHKGRMHLLNFAVASSHRRNGVGSQMVGKLEMKLASHRRSKLTLAIRERNLAGQMFFRSQGFRCVKTLRAYYPETGEDALLMELYSTGDDVQLPNRIAQHLTKSKKGQ